MPATRDGKTWRSQFYYEDWQGVRHKKNKRGFKTKAEAEEWERNFRQQQRKDLDINFENFVEIYFADMENRLRESTIKNKRYVFDLKVTPYFKKKKMCEIKTADIRACAKRPIMSKVSCKAAVKPRRCALRMARDEPLLT